VVKVGNREFSVRFRPAAHRDVARRDEYQVAVEDPRAVDPAFLIYGGHEQVIGANFIEQLAYRKDLPHGADEERVVRLQVDEDFARVEVDYAEAPDRARVKRLVEYRAYVGRDVRARAAAASIKAESGRDD